MLAMLNTTESGIKVCKHLADNFLAWILALFAVAHVYRICKTSQSRPDQAKLLRSTFGQALTSAWLIFLLVLTRELPPCLLLVNLFVACQADAVRHIGTPLVINNAA